MSTPPPYAGPPHYGPYGPPPVQQHWGPPPPGWGWTPYPPPPQRPGTVIAAAVLAFASALLVVVGTVYAMAFSALLSLARGPDAGMRPVSALLQLGLAGLLVVGGLRVLAHDRRWLLGATAVQLAVSGYWAVVLADLAPATLGSGVLAFPLVYAALALVAAGLTVLPDARDWTSRRSAPSGLGG